MATTCYIPILGKRMRVTALDSCGNVPAAGTVDSQLVTDGFISVALTAEVEDGAEIIQKKADGSLCVNEKLSNVFKRFTVEATFCGVNPSLIAMVTNARGYNDYTVNNVAGVAVGEGPVTKKFALELWTGISGQACLPGAAFLGGYFLLPFVNAGIIGDITVDGENAVNFSMTGAYTRGQNAWGVGPYNVLLNGSSVASQLPLALDPYDHLLLVETSYAPPASACAPLPMTPYITTVSPGTSGVAGGTVTTVTGSGFSTATAINFGGTAGTAFSVLSDTQVRATTPAKTAGTYDVTVVRPGGNVTKTASIVYT
jgi:hypothetical protein